MYRPRNQHPSSNAQIPLLRRRYLNRNKAAGTRTYGQPATTLPRLLVQVRRMDFEWRSPTHRFRHTFGSDMVRAGMSLPALQHLMGHSHIQTTMLYVELAPQDVWREYACAIERRKHLGSGHIS